MAMELIFNAVNINFVAANRYAPGGMFAGPLFVLFVIAAAAAESIARQPAAAAQISGAVNLPLFLLEGVSIIAEVVVLLIVLLK